MKLKNTAIFKKLEELICVLKSYLFYEEEQDD